MSKYKLTRRSFVQTSITSLASGLTAIYGKSILDQVKPFTMPKSSNDDDWSAIRSHFILDDGVTYMNNASLGMPPLEVVDSVNKGYKAISKDPLHGKHHLQGTIKNNVIPASADICFICFCNGCKRFWTGCPLIKTRKEIDMDLFKVGSNIQSMQALNNLYKLNEKMSVHQSRLSTGKRVNSAQDDTAGFSVAKNVETTRQGYEQAHQNIKNAQSVLSIVEAGQQKQLELLQSLKDKVVQAQDSTLNTDQRQAILNSVTALKNELADVAAQMTFNGSAIASGAGTASTFRVGSGTATSDSFAVTSTVISAAGSVSISSTSASAASGDITAVQNLIDTTLNRIANTGSAIERLKHKEDIVAVQVQNHEAVRSTYEDADFAKEQMELMKVQILQQTATASLAQANSAPQLVLSLFR